MDNLSKSSLNFLTTSSLDRMAGIRFKKQDFRALLNSPEALFVIVKKGENLLSDNNGADPLFLKKSELKNVSVTEDNCFLLGYKDANVYFALGLAENSNFTLPADAEFSGLRKSKLQVKNWTGSLLAYTNALITWHGNHGFCGKCGSPTKPQELGQARYCTDEDCKTPHYPRTDPAIIVVVTRGDKCLMARKSEWADGMYSLVAGYVDHGESLEDTVVREVMEETSIKVKSVHYHSSQPWPFPYTLMVGFFAEAENDEIHVDTHELEDAQWFSREEIIEGLKAGSHKLPTILSISRKLITDWFDQGSAGKLEDYL